MYYTLNWSIRYGVLLCVARSGDKIIFGKGTKLLVEVGKLIAFKFWLTIAVSVSVLTIKKQRSAQDRAGQITFNIVHILAPKSTFK